MGDKSTTQQPIDETIDANTVKNTKAILDQLPDHSRGAKLSDFTKANDEFPEGLSPAEKKLLHSCVSGEECVIGDGTRPTSATRENKIRASFLRYLILGGCDDVPVHQKGIYLEGAFIVCRSKRLDLQSTVIEQDIYLVNSKIDGSIIFLDAKCQTLCFNGTHIVGIKADGVQVEGSLFFRNGFQATEEVRLLGAIIKGGFNCTSCKFNGMPKSLSCDGIEIDASIFLCDGFTASGEVRLLGVKIGGDLTCMKGVFLDDLTAQNSIISGNVFLDDNFQIKVL